MINFENTGEKIDQLDKIFDKGWKFIKKHWLKLIGILLLYTIYIFIGLVNDELKKDDVSNDIIEPYFIEESYKLDEIDNTIYNDGTTDEYY